MKDLKCAKYWEAGTDKNVKCLLCPHECVILEGKTGICHARKNVEGALISEVYGKLAAIHLDPIEKKPLFHFYPGSKILSIGTTGCNLRCFFCQNYSISQTSLDRYQHIRKTLPTELVKKALAYEDNIGIAFTYNEPTVFYEYMYDVAVLSKENKLNTIMVTNGFISEEPLKDILPFIDGFNVDLKSFSNEFYRKYTGSRIQPVKSTLKEIKKQGKHLEITFLVVPGLNDSESQLRDMISWIRDNFGETQVLHISRYFPNYLSEIPSTPLIILHNFYDMAREKLKYVYPGNVSGSKEQNTYCHHCGKAIIERDHFSIKIHLDKKGSCPACNTHIIKYI